MVIAILIIYNKYHKNKQDIIDQICFSNYSDLQWQEFSDKNFDIVFEYSNYLQYSLDHNIGPYGLVSNNDLAIKFFTDNKNYSKIFTDIEVIIIKNNQLSIAD